MITSRLYLKIYLTVLGSLALVVVTLGGLAYLGRLDTKGPFEENISRLAAAMLTEDMDSSERQRMLDRISRSFGADIAIFDGKGHFLQGAGEPVPDQSDEIWTHDKPRYRVLRIELPEGRTLVAYMARRFAPPRAHLIYSILITVLVIGAGAYPIVRNLTRRLDLLRASMDRWGHGELSVRAPTEGRDEIATVARTFNIAADRVETMIKSQKSLLANASHELRSPLARLRMAAEMFNLNQNAKNRDEIVKNLTELDDIVEEILLKSRLGSEIPPTLDQTVDVLAVAMEEASITDAGVEGDAELIIGNERLIRRLIRNLLQNAERHGKPPITVTVGESAEFVHIRIRDHGPGITREDHMRVFEPFFRPRGRSEADGGWGLGLSLVAEIAQLHGGTALVENSEGPGASFRVDLRKKPSGGDL